MSKPAPSRAVRSLTLAAILLSAGAASAGAQQILEIHGNSLTTTIGGQSPVQLVQPPHIHRGINIDGSLREPSTQGWACVGNPFGDGAGWGGHNRLGDMRLDTGTYNPLDIDLALPSAGVPWIIGRTFNGRQAGGITSDGYQGKNWMQTSQAELVRYEGSTDADDVVIIVYGADRFLEFKRTGSSSDYYKGVNGAAGVIKRTAGVDNTSPTPDTPEKYEYTDQHGTVTTFYGETYAAQAAWQIWRVEDTAGNRCYVGHATDMASAISSYNDDADYPYGAIETAYDSAGRRYTYTYEDLANTLDGVSRLLQVEAEVNDGGWVTVGQVDYSYYNTNINDVGLAGYLRTVKVTTPMTSGGSLEKTKYYRYYTRTWNDSDGRRGHAGQVKMVLDEEGWRRYEGSDANFGDNDYLTETESNLKPYSAVFFEYESSSTTKRISTAVFNGECGCAGGANGTHEFAYGESSGYAGYINTSSGTGLSYDNGWGTRTVVEQPDGTYITQYFDETGQALSRVLTAGDPSGSPTGTWVTEVLRGASTGSGIVAGCISELRTPAANDTYTHSTGSIAALSGAGLIRGLTRTDSGNLTGFVTERRWKVGTGGSTKYDSDTSYATRVYTGTTPDIVRPLVDDTAEYVEDDGSPFNTTSRTYTFHDATSTNTDYLAIESVTTAYEPVTTGNNGSNSATSMVQWFNAYGAPTFTKAPDGIISYREYSTTTGQMVKSIEDADTGLTGGGQDFNGVTIPSSAGTAASSGTEIHNKTTYAYDQQGRVSTVTMPSGRVAMSAYVILNDRRTVTLSTPMYEHIDNEDPDPDEDRYYGPAGYSISNHAGKGEAQGTIGFSTGSGPYYTTTAPASWVTASGNELTCITTGAVSRLSVTAYNNPGNQVTESRVYHNFTTLTGGGGGNPWPGNQPTYSNYDKTTFAYDGIGRRIRTVDPTGTIDRVNYDALGRAISREVGTDDTGDPGSTMAGTNNMVITDQTEYDGGNDGGNSHVTERIAFIQDNTTGQRVSSYTNDDRGRVILITNPEAPHILSKYDNLGRTIATAQYNAVTGLSASSDPTSVATADSGNTDRLALSQTSYDQKGQVFRTTRHKIDQTDGSDDDSIATDYWFDSVGRRIKVQGEELSKTRYDRLGRATHQFVLGLVRSGGVAGETGYTDADDVDQDVVLEEHQTVYENATGNVDFSVEILRHAQESASTYGALDSHADGSLTTVTAANIRGRVQITAHWYDDLDRRISTVSYGTNAIVGDASTSTGTFTHPGGNPLSRPNTTTIQTDYTYPDSRLQHLSSGFYGTYRDVKDPLGKVTRSWFDDAGRTVMSIANNVNGVPSGVTGDDDVYTRNEYTHGLQTKMWVDLDGDGTEDSDDQVTSYTYGVTKGSLPASKIASGRLLLKVTYPPNQTSQPTSDREVEYAYNAQNQQIYVEDQAGNIIQHDYDTAGRLTARAATNIESGYNNLVQRIEIDYNSRGLVEAVTQKDGPGSGDSELDQVQYIYDGWGNLLSLAQDVDSAVGGSGVAAYEIEYALTKLSGTGARHAVVRDTMRQPDGTYIEYIYDSFSRVIEIESNSVKLSQYAYTGANRVVKVDLAEPGIYSQQYTSTLGVYPDLDQFNRVTSSRWTSQTAGDEDIYDIDVAYDLAGNITSTVDNIRKNGSGNRVFDVAYTMDGLHRLIKAEEGTISGGVFSTNRRVLEQWGLTQTGNFATNQLSLNGDTDFVDADEIDDTRTHYPDNSIESWEPDGTQFDPAHDLTGNMTDDDCDYTFQYDVFGRMVSATNKISKVATEYRYNGLGHRIGWHYDVDLDGDVESNADDPWVYHCYDERWRVVATYIAAQTTPKEQFYYHAAGLGGVGGHGGSSYIDSVILRDRDMTDGGAVGFTEEGDGTLEERVYYCQNWRADVSVLIDYTSGNPNQAEAVKYFSYGTPIGLPAGDCDSDGDVDYFGDLVTVFVGWTNGSVYDVRGDMDLDGDLDSADSAAITARIGSSMGRGVLSQDGYFNRKGYAGYENDGILGTTLIAASNSRFWHVRHRVLDSTLGRWTRRDPLGYVETTPSLLVYGVRNPIGRQDPTGLISMACSERRASRCTCGGQPCQIVGITDCSIDIDVLATEGSCLPGTGTIRALLGEIFGCEAMLRPCALKYFRGEPPGPGCPPMPPIPIIGRPLPPPSCDPWCFCDTTWSEPPSQGPVQPPAPIKQKYAVSATCSVTFSITL